MIIIIIIIIITIITIIIIIIIIKQLMRVCAPTYLDDKSIEDI